MTRYQYKISDTEWGNLIPHLMFNIETTHQGRLVYDTQNRSMVWAPGQWRIKPNNPLVDVDPDTFGVWCIDGMNTSWVCQHNQQVVRVFKDGSFLTYDSIRKIPIFSDDVVTKVAQVGDTE